MLNALADSNPDRLEAELLKHAPQDAAEIRRFTSAIRRLSKLKMPDAAADGLAAVVKDVYVHSQARPAQGAGL